MLMSWPGGFGTELYLQGRARDLHTPTDGTPRVVAEADLDVVTGNERDIQSIEADPDVAGVRRLLGVRAGSGLRAAIAAELPGEVEGGTPLYLLLDDLGGATLIAGYTYFRWADVLPEMRRRIENGPQRVMQGTCSGFREGSIACSRPMGRCRTSARTRRAPSRWWIRPTPSAGMSSRSTPSWACAAPGASTSGHTRGSSRSTPGSATASGCPKDTRRPSTSTRSWARPTARRERSWRCAPCRGAALCGVPRRGTERREDGGDGPSLHAGAGAPTDSRHRLLHTPERWAALPGRGPRTRGRVARLTRP